MTRTIARRISRLEAARPKDDGMITFEELCRMLGRDPQGHIATPSVSEEGRREAADCECVVMRDSEW